MEDLVIKCKSCAFYQPVDPPEGKKVKEFRGLCYFNPPNTVLMPRQTRVAMQEPQMQFVTKPIRPPVGENEFCGRWKPNAEMYEKMSKAESQCGDDCNQECGEECNCGS